MGRIKHSAAWWCYVRGDMTPERFVRAVAEIGYDAVELVDQSYWQMVKDHGLGIASVGGHVQQYQIDVDPNRLRTYNLPLSAVVSAVRSSNLNVGGNVLESNGAWLIVRGIGLIKSLDDVKQIVIGGSNGVPIYVEQVATVEIGNAFRVASLVKGTQEAVGGGSAIAGEAESARNSPAADSTTERRDMTAASDSA